MRSFEKIGLTRQQAERLTEHLTGILCVQKEKLGEQFVSKGMLEKARRDACGHHVRRLQQAWLDMIAVRLAAG